MLYDYSKLCGAIAEIFGTQRAFALAIGLSEHSVSQKLNCKVAWKQTEIAKACDLLGINQNDISKYFFTQRVQ